MLEPILSLPVAVVLVALVVASRLLFFLGVLMFDFAK
jgi:hypothetical protein